MYKQVNRFLFKVFQETDLLCKNILLMVWMETRSMDLTLIDLSWTAKRLAVQRACVHVCV